MAKNWYIVHTYTGYEAQIERKLRRMLEHKELDATVVTDVKVPIEEIDEVKDGKRRTRKNKFLPSYIMIELDLPEIGWKETCTKIRSVQGVTGFVGTSPSERPRPITADEAKNLLQKSGVIKGERPVHVRQSFAVGDAVRITDGPFATFTGKVDDVNVEKDRLRVTVQIFGRETPVEVSLTQAEKV
ncbi:MAG: transcription termination/antitermination factor NusG [Treponema sp.]|nr:transcription termination/antitermination factor NusG [Treponema sp.]